ncbi:MAG: alpha/beta fold hydrolase [Verrucomicrobia bacterium]|nr:alpha/beta fold hydrolase [Verrucomicrobiota bacterium]
MYPPLRRAVRVTCLFAALAAVSCSAPISFRKIVCKPPAGEFVVSPLSDALRELEAGKAAKDPLVASGHFYDSARLAGQHALAGENGALGIYNQAVGLLVERLGEANALPWGRTIALGAGGRTLRGKLEPGAPAQDRHFVSVATLAFKGSLANTQAAREGVGAPLVAVSPVNPDSSSTFGAKQPHQALTAVLRFENAATATLELHDPLETERISIAGRNPVLAANFTAPISMFLALARPDKLGLTRLLDPQKYADTARLVRLQKFDPNRIPVIFVHGLDSTPVTWAPMYNNLMQDPEIRRHYQFWVFSYPSGYPYFYSASLFRNELIRLNKVFPAHRDIVLVGHSMGGIISRLMVTDAGDTIWRAMFGTAPADTKIAGKSRKLLEDSLIFHNRPDIHRVVFCSAPHRGSQMANHWLTRQFARLVRIPTFLTDTRNLVASIITADASSIKLDRAPNSIDTLSPDNRFVREINKLPIAPGVIYHSIIGDRGKGDGPDSSDGVVPYWSSHLDGAVSEKIVPSGHSSHQDPAAFEEVRRILRLNLNHRSE